MSPASGCNSKKFTGGAGIQKELQGFAAFVAYQECHYKGLSASRATLEQSIGQQFFGVESDEDSIGLSEQLVKGIGVFSGLYTLQDMTSVETVDHSFVPPTNEFNEQVQDSVLMLKPELHCLGRNVQIACGFSNGISLPLILQRGLTNKDPVAIRTLLFRAQEYMKNCKKALSITVSSESPYKDYIKNGNLPSGMVHNDYLTYVRLKMFDILVNNAGGDVTCIDDEDDVPPTSMSNEGTTVIKGSGGTTTMRIMPDTWFFPGFFVFATVGPIVADDSMTPYRSELLMTTSPTLPPDEKVLAGRNFERKGASAHRRSGKAKGEFVAVKRASGSMPAKLVSVKSEPGSASSTLTGTPSNGHNEVTLHHQLVAAGIAQSKLIADCQHQSRLNDRKVAYRKNKIAGKERLIEEKRFQVNESDPCSKSHATF
jgi:hypothetical protein